jgi:hypothetical protein
MVATDEILDAFASAVTAVLTRENLQTLPQDPPLDANGLRMEMVFAEASSTRQRGRSVLTAPSFRANVLRG